jgi:hypothetical protein
MVVYILNLITNTPIRATTTNTPYFFKDEEQAERYLNRIFRAGLQMGGNRHGIREQYEFIPVTPGMTGIMYPIPIRY